MANYKNFKSVFHKKLLNVLLKNFLFEQKNMLLSPCIETLDHFRAGFSHSLTDCPDNLPSHHPNNFRGKALAVQITAVAAYMHGV